MLTLIVIAVILVLLAVSVSRAARRQREALEERRRAAERQRKDGGEEASSPFSMLPFGGLFDQLLTGPGGWSRSLMYDEETGRWVDVSDAPPDAPEDERDSENGTKPPAR